MSVGNFTIFCFTVYKKHYPPALNDEVWRLEKIGKDGSFHKRLNKAGICTVEDFLRLVVRDSQRLRNVRMLHFPVKFKSLYITVLIIFLFLCCRFLEVACQIRCGMSLLSMQKLVF